MGKRREICWFEGLEDAQILPDLSHQKSKTFLNSKITAKLGEVINRLKFVCPSKSILDYAIKNRNLNR